MARGHAAPETAYGCARGAKLCRAKPQERDRSEIGSGGSGRMKASRGWENLKTPASRLGMLAHCSAAAPCYENAVGERTSGKAIIPITNFGWYRGGGLGLESISEGEW